VSGPADSKPRSGLEVLRGADSGEPMPPDATLLGWKALSLEPGRVRVQFTAREEFYNAKGHVQGGFLAAMLDAATGPALFTLLTDGDMAPTLELKVSFLRPAKAGTIIGEGWVVHRTRNIAFLEGTLSTEDGELMATASATARVMETSRGEP
jgi:uncharacterized protein (TIGR00369 family)